MKIFKEYRQDQSFLLPPSLDEFVPQDYEVRVINDVVGILDLSPLFSRYEGGGAPAYHPAMMLKVTTYAYSLDIYSSRRIAQELKANASLKQSRDRDGLEKENKRIKEQPQATR